MLWNTVFRFSVISHRFDMALGRGHLRVFIVEDEPSIASALRVQLGLLGYPEPQWAQDRASALELVQQERPDLVIMDIQLANGDDGAELAVELRDRWGVPSIFLTSHTDDSTLERCKAAEPAGYLLKPFSLQLLKVTLEMALHREMAIRARREAEERRRRSESLFRAIVDNAPLAILSADEHDVVQTANPAAEALFQRPVGEFRGQPLAHLLKDPVPRGDGVVQYITSIRSSDGRSVPVSVCALKFGYEGEQLTNLFFSDLRARLALESQLTSAQDNDALVSLTATVAHDLNNLLGSLQTFQFLLDTGKGTPNLAAGDVLGHMVQRGSLISDKLFQLGQSDEDAPGLQLRRFLEGSMSLFASVVGAQRSVTLTPPPSDPDLFISPQRLRQALLHVLRNAKQATQPGSVIHLTIVDTARDSVDLQVQDTGTGMPPDVQRRAFEPFFSTRTGDGAHGLGLSIVERTITAAGGAVWLESVEGQGTTVTLRLPRTQSA